MIDRNWKKIGLEAMAGARDQPRPGKRAANAIDPRFNRGNKLRPKYESPVDQQENLNQEPLRTAPKSTRLRPPMQNLSFDPRVHRGNLSHKYKASLSLSPHAPTIFSSASFHLLPFTSFHRVSHMCAIYLALKRTRLFRNERA